ncbi:MAG: hypothetical protein WCF14_02320, partial [Nitrososphaeraceae archaeon]
QIESQRGGKFSVPNGLDDLDYIPLDSISDDFLYRSIKESLEQVGKAYSNLKIRCTDYSDMGQYLLSIRSKY